MNSDEKKLFWEELINEFEKSSGTLSAFCKTWDVAPWKFHYWRKKIKEDKKAFVELDVFETKTVNSIENQNSGILIYVRNTSIEVTNDFNEDTLKRLVNCLSC